MGLLAGIKVAASSFLARFVLAYFMALPTLEGWAMYNHLALRSPSLYLRSQLGHRAGRLSSGFRYLGRKLYKRGLMMKGPTTFVIDRGKF